MTSPKADCLRAHYDDAFKDWSLQLSRLHAVIESSPGGAVVDKAEERAAAAEVAYRKSRGRITDETIAQSGRSAVLGKSASKILLGPRPFLWYS